MAFTTQFDVEEDTSYRLSMSWTNQNDTPVALADVANLTLTLYDVRSGIIINERGNQDILNVNDVTYHATSGLLIWAIQPEDMQSLGNTSVERHRALFHLVLVDGASAYKEIDFLVRNLITVPA